MSGLGSEDGTGNGHVGGVGDGTGGTEVGRDTDVLNEGGETDKRVDVGDGELVLARLGGSVSDGPREESDVLGLVLSNVLNSVSDPVWVAGAHEVVLRELGEVGGVEVVLEVLEGQSELENVAAQGVSEVPQTEP